MASREQHRLRDEIGTALASQQWHRAGELALQLRIELEAILRDRAIRGVHGDKARAWHRAGLYIVGFQHYLHAPKDVRGHLDGLNAALQRLPIGTVHR